MRLRGATFLALVAIFDVAVGGCVPHRSQIYASDDSGGQVLYSTCAFNSRVPTGMRLSVQDIDVTISLSRHEGRPFVEVRFDIPEGTSLQLTDPTVQLETNTPANSTQARFPSVSLVDSPIVNSLSNVPATKESQLPPTALLVGQRMIIGDTSFNRHFWLATYVDVGDAEDIWVTLPAPIINGTARPLPRLHFRRRWMTIVALFNC
jgi:hypothetical protein